LKTLREQLKRVSYAFKRVVLMKTYVTLKCSKINVVLKCVITTKQKYVKTVERCYTLMSTNIYVIDDSLNNDKPNTVVVFEGEQVFNGRDASPTDIIELLELGQLAENIFYKKAKTADLEDWENAIYG